MKRREEVRARIGTDDPYILAMVMQDYLSNRHYHNRDKKIAGVRLFPLDRRIIKEADLEFNQFPQILAYGVRKMVHSVVKRRKNGLISTIRFYRALKSLPSVFGARYFFKFLKSNLYSYFQSFLLWNF